MTLVSVLQNTEKLYCLQQSNSTSTPRNEVRKYLISLVINNLLGQHCWNVKTPEKQEQSNLCWTAQCHPQGILFTHMVTGRKGFTNYNTFIDIILWNTGTENSLSSCLTLSFFKGQVELMTRKTLLKTLRSTEKPKALCALSWQA